MKTNIELKAEISIDFYAVLKLIQHGIRDDAQIGCIPEDRLEECLTSVDFIHDDFCNYLEDYINKSLPINNAYDNIYDLCGEEGLDKIKDVFWEWLMHNKKELHLHTKQVEGNPEDLIIVDVDGYEGLPHVVNLGDGIFEGKMAGHSFIYNGCEYYCEVGVRCPFYIPQTVRIKDGKEVY